MRTPSFAQLLTSALGASTLAHGLELSSTRILTGAIALLAGQVQAAPQFLPCSIDDNQIGCRKKRDVAQPEVVARSPEPEPQFLPCSIDDNQIGCRKKRDVEEAELVARSPEPEPEVVERSPAPEPIPQFLPCSIDNNQIGC
ncbi:hypothetical protein M0657_010420 [Pyricularia oryzae]|uniref:Uncharacterized protein n=1 Tax=Pyricularia oryzae (strain Y34) TaxID=1143189 RepID=A0AA97PM48_PYRO3|nr:hypothetical protein OOU_Y34scaffold00489g6 [Pyricularia oryzae Y34]KAI7912520.1 hypothetical protein M0657_010420 [Pyricularia oryzae]